MVPMVDFFLLLQLVAPHFRVLAVREGHQLVVGTLFNDGTLAHHNDLLRLFHGGEAAAVVVLWWWWRWGGGVRGNFSLRVFKKRTSREVRMSSMSTSSNPNLHHGGEAVGDDQGGAVQAKVGEGALHLLLRRRVKCARGLV